MKSFDPGKTYPILEEFCKAPFYMPLWDPEEGWGGLIGAEKIRYQKNIPLVFLRSLGNKLHLFYYSPFIVVINEYHMNDNSKS